MLSPEQRLDAFVKNLKFRNRGARKDLAGYSDKELIRKADEFLKCTSWADRDAPEDLVRRLRKRWAQKSGKTRSKSVAKRKAHARAEADAARQFILL